MARLAILYVTFPDIESARSVSRQLVVERKVACVQILPGVECFYAWDGQLEETQEVVVIFKTLDKFKQSMIDKILEQHPYQCPCILEGSMNILNPAYEQWLKDNVSVL